MWPSPHGDSWKVADPADKAHYLKHKSADELRPLAGGTDAAVFEVSQWLRELGGADVTVSALGDTVTASFDGADKDASRWSARGIPSSKPPSAALVTRRDFTPPCR